MSQKPHESDTLKQRKLANKEFLELKKMQRGEIKPDNTANSTQPQTLEKKAENFWFYYGKFLIIGILIAAAVIFSVAQCINKPKYDLKILYFTYEPVTDKTTEALEKDFEKYCSDTNGDGEVKVAVVNCSCSKNGNSYAIITKLQALIASDNEAMMFITDDESVKYFDNIRSDDYSFFAEKTVPLPEKFLDDFEYKPEGNLTVSIRNTSGTNIEDDSAKYLNTAKKLLDKIDKIDNIK